MNHLKKIEDRVISILKTNVDARSDDMMLYLLVCNSFYSSENSVGKMPFEVVMKNYKELELPHFESVRRTRAKIQSEHPELACCLNRCYRPQRYFWDQECRFQTVIHRPLPPFHPGVPYGRKFRRYETSRQVPCPSQAFPLQIRTH